jgi:Ran GTPase-activating protein (RanGAP) involved in mRNA processing and transport
MHQGCSAADERLLCLPVSSLLPSSYQLQAWSDLIADTGFLRIAFTTNVGCVSLLAPAVSAPQSNRQSFRSRPRIPVTKVEKFSQKKIRFRRLFSTLREGLQEAIGFRFSDAVDCCEDDASHVLLIARCRGQTFALRVPSAVTATVSEIGLDVRISNCNAISLLRGRFFAESSTLEFVSMLPGGVSDEPALKDSMSNMQPVQSRSVAALLQQCAVQAQLIHTIARAGSTFVTDCNRKLGRPALKCAAPRSALLPEEFFVSSDIIEPLTEYGEDTQAAQSLFAELGALVGPGGIDLLPIDAVWEAAQLRTAVRERTFLESLHAKLLAGEPNAESAAHVPFSDFLSAYVTIPRVRGERVRWAGSLGLDTALAQLLRPGDTFDGLRGLRELSVEEAEVHVREVSERLAAALPGLLRAGLKRLWASTVDAKTVAEHFNAKFVTEGLTVGKFASLEEFYQGPEALLGMPNPRVFEGMKTEHCNRLNASRTFTAPNYNVETFPKQEWEIVVSPVVGTKYPHTPVDKCAWPPEGSTWYGECGRDVVGVDELMMREEVRVEVERARLLKDEVICLRLYSGPMFLLYNAAMRGEPQRDVKHLEGNKYETTIFVIASGITKLSKMTAIPVGRRLYRGLGGDLQLPDQFLGCLGECRVTFTVHTRGSNIVLIVKQALMDKIVPKQSGVPIALKSRLVLQTTVSAVGGTDEHLVDVGLMTAPYVDGNNVRLGVALPASKCGGGKTLEQFIKIIHAFCVASLEAQDSDLKITVDEVLENPKDFRGGVELGMLSLTASKETAMRYGKSVSGRRGTVFEVQVGRVDVGASIGFLSQYPREQEYLMPPLSCLEVIGEPRLDSIGDNAEVMIVPLRVNVNLKSATVEELIGRRKILHAATAKNLIEELTRNVKEQVEKLELIFQQRHDGKAEHLRGLQEHVEITQATESGCEVHFPGCRWATVGAPYLTLSSGLVFFEVEIIEAKGQLAVGFAGTQYRNDVTGEIGDDKISWGVYSFDKNRHSDRADPLPPACIGWFVPGSVLGLAVDLQTGQMLARVMRNVPQVESEKTTGSENCGWEKVFESGVSPCQTAGGGLFPVLAGGWGARVKYNFGHTGMQHTPPTADYFTVARAAMVQRQGSAGGTGAIPVAFGVGGLQISTSTANLNSKTDELLEELRNGRNDLLLDFQKVYKLHLMLKPEEFNNDEVYKEILNQIIDTKSCLERKQAAMVELLQAGATSEQLSVVRAAPVKDFCFSNSLEVECPGYSWRLILSGWFCFLKEVHVPLECAPCLIAVLWRELLEGEKNPLVILDAGEYGHKVTIAELVPTLQLKTVGLCSRRFEHAVLALVLASTSKISCASKGGSGEEIAVVKPWALIDADFRGMDFSKDRVMDLARAVFVGRLQGPLRKVNGLVIVQPVEGGVALQNLRYCVLRDNNPVSKADVAHAQLPQYCREDVVCADLGLFMDPVDWSFVAAEAACERWKTLDLSQNNLGPTGSTGLSIGLGAIITLTMLDLSSNNLMPAGATAVSFSLAELTALVRLELGFNCMGAAGGSSVAQSLSRLTRLQILSLSSNEIGSDGASIVCTALSALTLLTSLDLSVNSLNENGGEAVLKMLKHLNGLKVIKLGGQDLGSSVFPILAVLVPRIISLSIAFGSVTAIPASYPACSPPAEGAFNLLSEPAHLTTDSHNAYQYHQQVNTIDLKDRQMLGAEGSVQLANVLRAGLAAGSLTALELAHNCLRLEGAKALGSVLFQLSALTRLDLSHNEFEGLGARCFVREISKLSELLSLSLEGNCFGAAGWVSLSDSLDWMPRLKSLNSYPEYYTLRTGSVQVLDLSRKELAAVVSPLLPRCSKNLIELDASHSCLISRNNGTPDSKAVSQVIASFSTLSALTRLSVSDNSFGTVGGHALGVALTSLVLLTALDVSRTELREDGATALAEGVRRLTALIELLLEGNRIGAHGVSVMFDAFPVPATLHSLDIGDNSLGYEGASIMAKSVCKLSRLKRLAAPKNHFGSVGGKLIGDLLAYISGLTDLDLASNELGTKGVEEVLNVLAKVASGPAPALLSVLNFSNNCIDCDLASAAVTFSGLEYLYSLETLILSRNCLGPLGGGAVLAALGTHTTLHTLDLGYAKLGPPGGLAVGNCLLHLIHLDSLFLEGNSLGDFGAAAVIKGLSYSSMLRTLDLSDNNLQKSWGLSVGKSLSLIVSLEALDLDGNVLGPEGGLAVARGLESVTRLCSLDLRDNALGSRGCRLVAECFTNFKNLHLDLRWNELDRRGRGKEPASLFSRLLQGTQSRKRQLISVKNPEMSIRGWLRKLNAVKEGEMENDENWRDRLCFVRDRTMFYKSAKKKGQSEEVAELTRISGVHAAADGWPRGHFIFHVNIEHGRTMIFSASSADERAQWIAALKPI